MAKIADKYLRVDPWKLIEDGFHPEKSQVSESVFSLSNEHQGVRAYFDEGYSGDSLIGCYLNGIYEEWLSKEPLAYKGISNRLCFMVNTVNWLYTRIEVDGEQLDLFKSTFSQFKRQLDFRSGELIREFIWETASGKRIHLEFSRLLSMKVKEQALQKISLRALNFSGPVSIRTGLDFSILHRIFGENFWQCPQRELKLGQYALLGVSRKIGQRLFVGCHLHKPSAAEIPINQPAFVGADFVLNLEQDQPISFEKRTVLYSSRNPQIPLDREWELGQAALEAAQQITYDQTLRDNQAYWDDFWSKFDIGVDGDPETQQGIRFCIFQMQQTYRGVLHGGNIGAKGLTGEFYNGNAFWDSETYCMPFFLFSDPQAAKALLDFRYKTLPQAMERARDLDCEGACFPVATIDGTESCTLWQHASLQFQPTTSVAYAVEHYVHITEDKTFLFDEGIELLIQICRFLASRGQWSSKTGLFGYYSVMGPDEFQMMVNHNAYTNFTAKRSFEYTLKVLEEIREADPQRYAVVMDTLQITPQEISSWVEKAQKMYIPYDAESGLFEQNEGFFNMPHLDVDSIPVEDFPLYHHWSYDRIYRNDMIKQPDVLMFMLLYNQSFSLREKRVNYEYYEPRCIHESSLSPSVHSILASEIGRHQEAFELFRFATRIDLDNYNRNTNEGIHTTSIAAAWMNIVYGFGGMRSDGPVLSFSPTIPAHWQGYHFQIYYRGALLRLAVTQHGASLKLVEGDPVKVLFNGQLQKIETEGAFVEFKN